jgi:hypothetical protein
MVWYCDIHSVHQRVAKKVIESAMFLYLESLTEILCQSFIHIMDGNQLRRGGLCERFTDGN